MRRAFQRSLQKQGLKFKLGTKVRPWRGSGSESCFDALFGHGCKGLSAALRR